MRNWQFQNRHVYRKLETNICKSKNRGISFIKLKLLTVYLIYHIVKYVLFIFKISSKYLDVVQWYHPAYHQKETP